MKTITSYNENGGTNCGELWESKGNMKGITQ